MANEEIFLGAGTSLTFIPECDLYLGVGVQDGGAAFNGSTTVSVIQAATGFTANFKLVKDLYIGCTLERYATGGTLSSSHKIKSNDEDSVTIADTVTPVATDYFVINSYGAPVPAPFDGSAKRLLSDQWLGILESATFPTVEPDMKQVNLSLGGSRNYTYQYKGITNFGAADLNIVANHGAWLYYFLGKCTELTCTLAAATSPSTRFETPDANVILIEALNDSDPPAAIPVGQNTVNGFVETGPIFYRVIGNDICPPLNPQQVETQGDVKQLDRPAISSGSISKHIEYTFDEQDSDLLPSFAMEYNHSKLTGTNIYRTNSDGSVDEDLNFVQIARGLRVNTLTMTANENEEVKMTLSLNARNVHELDEDVSYDARRGQTDEKEFFNYEGATTGANSAQEFREPFFFSDGTFKVLGETFLKINTLTLTMNNNLQDRRFLGVSSKDVQESLPAQRTYEISFTGHVTNNALYKALRNDTENTTQTIELLFTKPSGETITLKFTDYFISANNFPISEDKGPIVVETTVMPRNLSECKVKTHWILQG